MSKKFKKAMALLASATLALSGAFAVIPSMAFADDGGNAAPTHEVVGEDGESVTHVLTHHDAKEATCKLAGNEEYWTCATCENEVYVAGTGGDAGKYVKSEIDAVTIVIDATAHDFTDVGFTEQEIDVEKYHVKVCKNTGSEGTDKCDAIDDASKHKAGEGEDCTLCEVENAEVELPCKHDVIKLEEVKQKEATCKDVGYNQDGLKCTEEDCGKYYTLDEATKKYTEIVETDMVIAKTNDHNYVYAVDTDDTTKHIGTCSVCDDKTTPEEHVDAKGTDGAADKDGVCDTCGATISVVSTDPSESKVEGMSLALEKAKITVKVYVSGNQDGITVNGVNNGDAVEIGEENSKIKCTVYSVELTAKNYDSEIKVSKGENTLATLSVDTYIEAAETNFGAGSDEAELAKAMGAYFKEAKAYLAKNTSTTTYATAEASDKEKENYRGSALVMTDGELFVIRNYYAKDKTFVTESITNYTLGKLSEQVMYNNVTVATYITKLSGKTSQAVADTVLAYDEAAAKYTDSFKNGNIA